MMASCLVVLGIAHLLQLSNPQVVGLNRENGYFSYQCCISLQQAYSTGKMPINVEYNSAYSIVYML